MARSTCPFVGERCRGYYRRQRMSQSCVIPSRDPVGREVVVSYIASFKRVLVEAARTAS